MFNNIILKGNLVDDPYYDVEPVQGTPFMRFYLAVDMASGLSHTYLHGYLAQPPYFDRIPPENCPFLRFYLRVPYGNGEQKANFIRCVAYGDRALFDYPYLRPASEVLVKGSLRARRHRDKHVVEVIADADEGITFISNVDRDRGDEARARALAARGENGRFERDESGGGVFRVVSFGDSARHDYPYLQKGSCVFVLGYVQTRKHQANGKRKTVVEVVARKISFLKNINWERGKAEKARRRRMKAR